MTKFFGMPESEEGLKKVEDSYAKVGVHLKESSFSSQSKWFSLPSVFNKPFKCKWTRNKAS